MNKIRAGGETISPDKTYSGRRVIELMNISFENGRANALREEEVKREEALRGAYKDGYNLGYSMASDDLRELGALLSRIIARGQQA